MDCEEFIYDLRLQDEKSREGIIKQEELVFKLNHTMRFQPEYDELLKELFGDNIGLNSTVASPIYGSCISNVKIGNNVYINSNCLMMARGGITIEDGVQIAANVQLLSNNHNPYDLSILICKPVLLKEHSWIGAGATILPGVCVGRHAIVGAGSVVTKDVPDFSVVAGNPAKVIRVLDATRFN